MPSDSKFHESHSQPLLPVVSVPSSQSSSSSVKSDKSTSFQTAANLLNELEGSGLLGLSYAVALAGWSALLCLFVVGTMAAFTGYCLARCMYEPKTGQRVRSTYKSVGEACYGRNGGTIVVSVQMLNLCSVGVVYLVLMSETLAALVPIFTQQQIEDSAVLAWIPMPDRRAWAAICTLAVLPTVHIGGYKKLSVMSYLGLLCLGTVLVLGIVVSSLQIRSNGGTKPLPEPDLGTFPAAYSIFVFAFSAHGIFPDLESSMANPSDFPVVVTSVFAVNMLMKVVFALVGFYAYGTDVDQVLTNSLPPTPRLVVSVLIVLNTFLSFPLPLIPVFRYLAAPPAADDASATATAPPPAPPPSARAQSLQRTYVVLCIGVASVLIPNFALAMGFMASVTLAFLTFIFPTLFYVKIHGPTAGRTVRVAAYFTMGMGVVGGVCGLVANANMAAGN